MRYESADLVVVGGGALGGLAALTAVRRGLSAVLVDQERPGTSRHEALGPVLRLSQGDLPGVRLARLALSGWHSLQDDLGESLLSQAEHLDLAPPHSARLDELSSSLDQAAQSYQSLHDLNRPDWQDLRVPTPLWGILSPCYELVASSAWLGIWELAQRAGVRCFADTRVRFLDLEYDRATAVGQDTAFRGRSLLVSAGLGSSALVSDLPPLRQRMQQWQRSIGPLRCPHLTVHFAGTPVRLSRRGAGYQLCRQRDLEGSTAPDPAETLKLLDFQQRFLNEAPSALESVMFHSQEGPEGSMLLAPHPLRADVVVAAGLADRGFALAPALARLGVDLCSGVEPPVNLSALAWPVPVKQ